MNALSGQAPQAPLDWRLMLALADGDDPTLSRLRGHQLNGLLRQLPLALFVLVASAISMAAMLDERAFGYGSAAWAGSIALISMALLAAGLRAQARRRPAPLTVAERGHRLRQIAALAATAALVFNWFPVSVALADPDPASIYAVALAQVAALAVCGLLLAPAPLAALSFLVVFAAALAFSAIRLGLTTSLGAGVILLAAIAAAGVFRGILDQAATLARHVRHLEDQRAKGEVIALLLHEFEQNSRDWLWEVDADGRVVHLASRFAEVAGRPVDQLIGRRLFDGEVADLQVAPDSPLRAAFSTQKTFRNLICPVAIDGDMRWWSISGSPRFADSGRFSGYIGVGSDVTELRRNREQIERMATSDGLTGLDNRAVVRGQLQRALDAARCDGGACALVMIDLDRFKSVNDSFGHPMGDELLREVARRIADATPQASCRARLGGDEFALVLPQMTGRQARSLVDPLIAQLSEPYVLRGVTVRIGASAGIAEGPADGGAIDPLIRAADLALYRAKSDGRGVARIYDPSFHRSSEERRVLEVALRGALRDNQLGLVFQPIYNLATNEIRGFEALLRWTHPELGVVSPARFIPIAEDIGVIDSIGEWVIRTACSWAARWPDYLGIAVNLSPVQLVNPRLPGVVLHALASSGVSPDRLELEITENVFLNESEATRAALAQLASLGVRIGLDDFGTGYSSLGYLRNSVFSTIKIDRVFVRDAVDEESQSAEIVRHIVSLANSLGMETVAEGAETSDELDAVRRLGCGNVQGFYTGRPMQPDEATELVGGSARSVRAA